MVAFFILIFVRVHIVLTFLIFINFFLVSLFTLILWLKATLLSISVCATLRTEAGLCLSHLVELLICAPLTSGIFIVFENFVLLVLRMFVLQPINDSLCFLLALCVFQIVHIKLIFQIVDVSVLLNVDAVVALKLCLETLVLFLVFGLNILNAFETLICSLKLLLTSTNFVLELGLVLSQLLKGILHFTHFTGLGVDDIADAFFDVGLFGVCVQIAANCIEEVKSFVSCCLEFTFLTKHIEETGAGLSNFSGQLTSSAQVMQFT